VASPSDVKQEDVVRAVDEILAFTGLQGARTTLERMDDVGDRRRIRVRVMRDEGKADWVYDVLIDEKGLMGIYRTA
jgi:hypothetical protein